MYIVSLVYICTVNLKETYTEKAGKILLRLGIRSVTVDDIARELGVSKKTIYVYFKNKKDLVLSILKQKLKKDREKLKQSVEESENAIDELLIMSKYIEEEFYSINPSILHDIKKYHAEAWDILEKHKWTFVLNGIEKNIYRGIKEDIYHNECNPSIIAKLYVGKCDLIMNGEIFEYPEHKLDLVFRDAIFFHIRGLVNSKGLNYLQKRLKNT